MVERSHSFHVANPVFHSPPHTPNTRTQPRLTVSGRRVSATPTPKKAPTRDHPAAPRRTSSMGKKEDAAKAAKEAADVAAKKTADVAAEAGEAGRAEFRGPYTRPLLSST